MIEAVSYTLRQSIRSKKGQKFARNVREKLSGKYKNDSDFNVQPSRGTHRLGLRPWQGKT